jgi:Ser/Thr protein kinase RdoA (MazF antagonist)
VGTVSETPFRQLTMLKLPEDEFVTIELVSDRPDERISVGSGLNSPRRQGGVYGGDHLGNSRRRHRHFGMRALNFATPHFTDRVDSARQLVASRVRTPELADADRDLLGDTLQRLRQLIGDRGGEQLLHGEPHSGNVLATRDGLLFIDFETCCRGPVEFDLAHAPVEVGEHYPGLDQALLRECRILVLAMVTTWRWDQGDQLPNGRQLAREWLRQIRAAIGRDS